MRTEFLIIAFNIVFFLTNLLYLQMVEKIFDVKSSKSKIAFFSIISSVVGTSMLISFGSMSTLGYFIMLAFYTLIVMAFYRKISFMTRMCCVLFFNLNIMFSRAMISSVISIISGRSILDISIETTSFWMILIYTSILTSLVTVLMLKILPTKFLRLIGQKTDYLVIYFALLIFSNIYMILNGNVYIHEIYYEWLPVHQIVAALTTLGSTYVGVFALVGFDMLRERRESLEQDALYHDVIKNRALSIVEVNCTKDTLTRLMVNGQAVDIPNCSFTEYTNKLVKENVHSDDHDAMIYHDSAAYISEQYFNGNTELTSEFRIITESGDVRWVRSLVSSKKDAETDDVIAVIAALDDIHETKSNEMLLHQKAQMDSLVGAYNKKATEMHIENYLNLEKPGALFMVDLDNFKGINDNFGHAYGDEVLKEIHSIIAANFREKDVIGRVGGDEFIVLLTGKVGIERISQKAEALCREINKVYTEDNVSVEISCSIGIALCPEHGKTFDELYQKADTAMYRCKKKTKNGYVLYSADIE